jgi:hypothetical protein
VWCVGHFAVVLCAVVLCAVALCPVVRTPLHSDPTGLHSDPIARTHDRSDPTFPTPHCSDPSLKHICCQTVCCDCHRCRVPQPVVYPCSISVSYIYIRFIYLLAPPFSS